MSDILRVALCLVLLGSTRVWGQSADNVLVVVNDASEESQQVGEYYARKRTIPPDHIVRIATTIDESISRADYTRQIEQPIARFLTAGSLQDRVLYIVTTKGVPLRIEGSSGRSGTVASVDSELTLLYRKMTGEPVAPAGPVANPYFLDARPPRDARLFTHINHDIYLVTRLDGYSVADVTELINRADTPSQEGRFVFDLKGTSRDGHGDAWLRAAAARLTEAGLGARVVIEQTTTGITSETNVLGYYSWGSNDPALRRRELNLTFAPGALAAMFVSSDARTMKEPPPGWQPGNVTDRRTWYAGSPQSLAADLVRRGVTGIAAQVAEPYLDAAIRPDVLFPLYASGYNLAEAFYLAMPSLSWQTVVIGDPLCAPFSRKPLADPDIHTGIDPDTEQPATFSGRAVARADPSLNREALRLVIRAGAQAARGDAPAARESLEKATSIEPKRHQWQTRLGQLYEEAGELDKAIDRYQVAISHAPNDVTLLNNLAYILAEKKSAPAEALSYAKRAYLAAPGSPEVLDTLGWTYHLLGDAPQAVELLTKAATLAPQSAETQYHAAAALLSVARIADAREHLNRALTVSPHLLERPGVKALVDRLAAP
jgi:uncharacterized protein (TIGR03790 family)